MPLTPKQDQWNTLVRDYTQEGAGGGHTAPELRVLLAALAGLMRAGRILETGYDEGMTTEALLVGSDASVYGVDNLSEYGNTEQKARVRLESYERRVILSHANALDYLQRCGDGSFDLIFLDDNHCAGNVKHELRAIPRLLRQHGLLVCHDTRYHPHIWRLITEELPSWPVIHLPCYSPIMHSDMGVAILQKPGEVSSDTPSDLSAHL